jgi:hypothetical protein
MMVVMRGGVFYYFYSITAQHINGARFASAVVP